MKLHPWDIPVVGLLAVFILIRVWRSRSKGGRTQRVNSNFVIIGIAVGAALMAIGAVIGLVWGHDKGLAVFQGTAAILAGAAAFESYRRKHRLDVKDGERDE